MFFSNESSIGNIDFGVFFDEPLLAAFGIQSGLCSSESLRVDQDECLFRIKA